MKIRPLGGSGPSGYYAGNDFRNAYAPGTTLNGTTTLGSVLSTLKPGDTVTLTVDRSGSTQTLTATLAEYPSTTSNSNP